jgi:hypothetical protein
VKLYGKRFMASRTDARIADRKESRDAIVYDIDEANRWCRVRIAGTDTLVRAWFPNNFMRSPQWLKVSTAVRIAHVGGSKSRIEVVSPGLVQPSIVMSPMQAGANVVLIGMEPYAAFDEATSWTVEIPTGTYRINGVIYRFAPGGPGMDNSGWHMGEGGDMAGDYWLGSVDPIASGAELVFRYDGFFIGTDGVVDYVKGEEWEWTGVYGDQGGPVKPTTPLNHALIRNYILVWTGLESITTKNIGAEWEAPYPDQLVTDYDWSEPLYEVNGDEEYLRMEGGIGIIYGGPNTYVPSSPGGPNRGSYGSDMEAEVIVTVIDQYGRPYGWWESGVMNQLGVRWLGYAGIGGYGSLTTGLGNPIPPDVTDESGYGEEVFIPLLLGSSHTFRYTRKYTHYSVTNPGDPSYPVGYDEADADGHTGLLMVRLVSEQATHPISTTFAFYNCDRAGNVV